jgi:hypothetical protein
LADVRISDLTADASPTDDDLLVTVNDPAGTPANRKITVANLRIAVAAGLDLGDLADVDITGLADGDTLIWDTGTSTYVPATVLGLTGTATDGYYIRSNAGAATWTQPVAAHISDFAEAVDDRVDALLVEGDNITLTYSDVAGTLTVAAAASLDTSTLMVVVTHGSTAGTARPSAGAVWWVGSVQPTNWQVPDAWFNTGDSSITGSPAAAGADLAWELEANTDVWELEANTDYWLVEG